MEKVEEGGGKDEKENDEDEDSNLSRRYTIQGVPKNLGPN